MWESPRSVRRSTGPKWRVGIDSASLVEGGLLGWPPPSATPLGAVARLRGHRSPGSFFTTVRNELDPQLTAFLTSVAILASSEGVSSFNAKPVGHIRPSSRFASSLKPSVAYRVLNFCALWKKQTTRSSLE